MNLNNGLIGHWTMDSADVDGGSVSDSTPNDSTATPISNSPEYGFDSVIGEAARFVGGDDYEEYLSIDYINFDEDDEWTVSVWVDTDDSIYFWFGNRSGVSEVLMFRNDGLRIRDGNEGYTNTIGSGLDDPGWHHATYVHDGNGRFDAYIDGVHRGYEENAITSINFNNIGSAYSSGEHVSFDGDMSDLRVYNRALSEKEINALYNMRSQRVQSNSLDRGLVGYWSMDSIDNDMVRDSSANDNHGEMVNDPQIVDGVVGDALEFDGENTSVFVDDEYGEIFDGSNAFSVTFSISTNTHGSDRAILSFEAGYRVIFNMGHQVGSDEINVRLDQDGSWQTPVYSTIETGVYYFVVFSYHPDNGWKLYIDSQLQDDSDLVGDINERNNDKIEFGSRSGAGEWFWDGTIGETRVYNRALSESEINRLYNQRK